MTGINHTLVGAIVGLTVKQPYLVAPIAFASHFVCDSLPHFGRVKNMKHWDRTFTTILFIDATACFTALAIILLTWPTLWQAAVVGMFFAALPDFTWLIFGKRKLPKNAFYRFHSWLQWGERPYGWIYELLYCALFILVLHKLMITQVS